MNSDNPVPTRAKLLADAQYYRDAAQELSTRPAAWVTGDRAARVQEKLEIAEYFDRLAAE